MAHVFYIRNLAEARAAQLRVNPSITPVADWNVAAGWYQLDANGAFMTGADGTLTTPDPESDATDDVVYLGNALTHAETADAVIDTGGGSDVYVIDRDFGIGVTGAPLASIGSTDSTAEIILAEGLEITHASVLMGNAVFLTFGNSARIAFYGSGITSIRRGENGEAEDVTAFLADIGYDADSFTFTGTSPDGASTIITGNNLTVSNEGIPARAYINGVQFRAYEAGSHANDWSIRFVYTAGGLEHVLETTPGHYIISLVEGRNYNQRDIATIWNSHFISRYTDNPDAYAVITLDYATPNNVAGAQWSSEVWLYENPAIRDVRSVYDFSSGSASGQFNIAYDNTYIVASGTLIVSGNVGRVQFGAPGDTDMSIDGLAQLNRGDGFSPYADESVQYRGAHGTLVVLATGDWIYLFNNVTATAEALAGTRATETFSVTITDSITHQTITEDITINILPTALPDETGNTVPITPAPAVPATLTITNEGARASAALYNVEFRADAPGHQWNGMTIAFAEKGNRANASYVETPAPGWGEHRIIIPEGVAANPATIADIWNGHYGGYENPNPFSHARIDGGVDTRNNSLLPPTSGGAWRPDVWTGESLTFTGGSDTADLAVSFGTSNTTASGYFNVAGSDSRMLFGLPTETDLSDDDGLIYIVPRTGFYPDLRKTGYQGRYGQLEIDSDGDWIYRLSSNAADFANLRGGDTATDDFTVTVTDSRTGTQAAYALSIAVERFNHAPTVPFPGNLEVDEESSGDIFRQRFFGYHDSDGDPFTQLRIDSIAGLGEAQLTFNGIAVTAGQVINVSQIENLRVIPVKVDNDTNVTFTYSVSDGQLFSATPATFTITINDNDTVLDIADKGTRASAIVNGIEFRALAPGSAYNDWSVAFTTTDNTDYLIANSTTTGSFTVAVSTSSVLQNNVVTVFNNHFQTRNAPNTLARARIVEVLDDVSNPNIWVFSGTTPFSGGSDAPDFDATEITDPIANGFIQVSDVAGEIIFSVSDASTQGGKAMTLHGTYGDLTIQSAGDWVYILDAAEPNLMALVAGETRTEQFYFTITDTASGTATPHTLTFNVHGTGSLDLDVADADAFIVDEGAAFVLDGSHISPGPARFTDGLTITYTLMSEARAGTLEVRNDNGTAWNTLAVGAGFTDAQLLSGAVRIAARASAASGGDDPTPPSFSLRAASSHGEVSVIATIETILRTHAEIIASRPGAGLNAGSASGGGNDPGDPGIDDNAPLTITTGLGGNTIRPGAGSDVVDAGLGDDIIFLGNGGRDIVRYRFDVAATTGNFIGVDGSDVVFDFTPGEDVFRMVSLDRRTAKVDTLAEFTAGLGSGYRAWLEFAHIAGRSENSFSDYNVTGITLAFPEGVALPGGVLSLPLLSINFANAVYWETFAELYLGGFADGGYANAFDTTRAWLKANPEGGAALAEILGLEVFAEAAPRAVLRGSAGNDSIATIAGTDSVVLGNGGDDEIMLNTGRDEIVYRYGDDGTTIGNVDDIIIIGNFTLGVDRLRLVDSDGEAAAGFENLLPRMAGAMLLGNEPLTEYAAIMLYFTLDGQRAEAGIFVEFASPRAAGDPFIRNLLGGTGDPWNGRLDNIIPHGGGDTISLVTAPEYIDDLFGGNIVVSDTLPDELL